MNAIDIILLTVIAAAVVWAVVTIVRNKKQGKGCCGDCSKCGSCTHSEGEQCRRQ